MYVNSVLKRGMNININAKWKKNKVARNRRYQHSRHWRNKLISASDCSVIGPWF